MKNIDLFNIICFEVFNRATDSFPLESTFGFKDITESIDVFFDENELQNTQIDEVIWSSIDWLNREGFLRKTVDESEISIVLTSKGLNATNSFLTVLDESKPFKDLIKDKALGASINAVSTLMIDFFKSNS